MLPLWDLEAHRRTPAITTALLVANLIVFAYEVILSWQGGGALERWVQDHALIPGRFIAGWRTAPSWAPLFTSMFLHGSVAHLGSNLWFLWVFGRTLENHLGGWRYLMLYGLAGVAAGLAQLAVDPGSTVPVLGASGAISGILGAYFRLRPQAWVLTLIPWVVPVVPIPAAVFLLVWFALQMVHGVGALTDGAGAGIAWWAHAGGFLAGVSLARWGRPRRRSRRSSRRK